MEIGHNFGVGNEQAVLFQTRQHVRNMHGNGHWLHCRKRSSWAHCGSTPHCNVGHKLDGESDVR